MKIVLASKSPRRQELIKGLELSFKIVLYEVAETFNPNDTPGDIAKKLAIKKAAAYPHIIESDEILITADTIVYINGQVLNKPNNEQEAYNMLRTICGNTHQVYTGVCLRSAKEEIAFTEMSLVTCKNLSDDEIYHYINNYQPFDKAGSYGIQDWFGYTAVEKIEGCYYNIMGLPISRVNEALKKLSIN
jgi:septum formation protein